MEAGTEGGARGSAGVGIGVDDVTRRGGSTWKEVMREEIVEEEMVSADGGIGWRKFVVAMVDASFDHERGREK